MLGGHPGYFVQLQAPKGKLDPLCDGFAKESSRLHLAGPLPVPGAGWTSTIWVSTSTAADSWWPPHHGPDSTPDEIDELVGMVESINFVDPAPEPDD